MSRPRLWVLAMLLPALVSPWLDAADAQWRSWFFQWRGPRPVQAALSPVVLAVDRESLTLDQLLPPAERLASPLWRQMGAWPWPRALQAELAATVLERGAVQVVFNVVHARPSSYGPADDQAFIRRLAPWRDRLVLAASLDTTDQAGFHQLELQRPHIRGWARVGLTSLLQSAQGITEAVPGRRWLQRELEDFPTPHPAPLPFVALRREPPPQPLFIDYPGPAGRVPQVPAWRVLEPPEAFWRGRTVVFGATAPELGDQLETPYGPQSGTQVQAAALASLRQGTAMRQLPASLAALLLVVWVGLGGWLVSRGAAAARTATIAATLAAAAVLLAALSWGMGWLLPITALVASPLLGGGVRSTGQWRRESRERQYLHDVLARRVSPTLLRDMLREPGPFWNQLGGSRARCVVLFTDLVGFTPLSAQLEPPQLFSLLNRYFAAIASAVIEEQGLLDKFIGDALMAEFGIPRSRGEVEEARAAVRAALAMRSNLEQLNRELLAAGQPALSQGIGLHFGDVIAGNLGSPDRLEFTVIGASVNVASRLEGLTRLFPDHSILISDALLALLPDELEVEPLGAHAIKGWPDPLTVYGLIGFRAS